MSNAYLLPAIDPIIHCGVGLTWHENLVVSVNYYPLKGICDGNLVFFAPMEIQYYQDDTFQWTKSTAFILLRDFACHFVCFRTVN